MISFENMVSFESNDTENGVLIDTVSKPDRMTVHEFFDGVWERVVEKHEKNR